MDGVPTQAKLLARALDTFLMPIIRLLRERFDAVCMRARWQVSL